MIPQDMLRHHAHFSAMNLDQLQKVAAISNLRAFDDQEILLREGNRARVFCLVHEGSVDVLYHLGDGREVIAETLSRGDAFGWSAMIEPHILTATCRGNGPGAVIEIEGESLREICEADPNCGFRLQREVSRTLRNRLSSLRVQIAASM